MLGRLAARVGKLAAAMQQVAAPFDASQPTHVLHRGPPVFAGRYATMRALLDYTWHTHYTVERQAVQDAIVDVFLTAGCRCERPWVLFTAGPMGAGKSSAMRHLAANGLFPLHTFVVVDPDRIKSEMPEMPQYVAANRALAGTLTHKESGFIAELVEREAMLASKNVLVDGSLRDADWYSRVFGRLRAHFPQYRIAVLLIQASTERIYERAERRAAITGRVVPREVIDDAIQQVPKSFEVLAPLADYSAVVDNDDSSHTPRFRPPATEAGFAELWLDIGAEEPVRCAKDAGRGIGEVEAAENGGGAQDGRGRHGGDARLHTIALGDAAVVPGGDGGRGSWVAGSAVTQCADASQMNRAGRDSSSGGNSSNCGTEAPIGLRASAGDGGPQHGSAAAERGAVGTH
jgi:hypothetical protein